MSQTNPPVSTSKSPLDAAQKIVQELRDMQKDDQSLALRFAAETLRLNIPRADASHDHHTLDSPPGIASVHVGRSTDIKAFVAEKKPRSDQQFATVVAYYYQFQAPADQRRGSIDAASVRDAARLAGRKQVRDWNVSLHNAVRTGYLDKAERGFFKLNSVGENLVAINLPDSGGASSNNGPTTKRKSVKKKGVTKGISKKAR